MQGQIQLRDGGVDEEGIQAADGDRDVDKQVKGM